MRTRLVRRLAALGAGLGLVAGCAARPFTPSSHPGAPPAAPAGPVVAATGDRSGAGPTLPSLPPPAQGAPTPPPEALPTLEVPPAASPPAAPSGDVAIEPAYKLDHYPFPRERPAFLADLADRTRWNRGGLGAVVVPAPADPGHPMPKVIIDITQLSGQHAAADLQRLARRWFWSKVVACYGLGAYKNQALRGRVTLAFQVTPGGKVKRAHAKSATLADPEVVACLADAWNKLEFPKARAGSAATAEIQVGPGDEPMPPPPALITPGDGVVDLDAAGKVVAAARPALLDCYRGGLARVPELWGRLAIRFHVTDKGKLDEAFEVESRFPEERVGRCVLAVARGLRFAAPQGGDARFVVPLRLAPGPAPAAGL